MFWTRKENRFSKGGYVTTDTPMYFLPTPPKKEICLMRELLSDIEKYDERGNIEVRNSLLTCLSEQIEIFKTKQP